MSINQLTTLTLAYLEAESGEMLGRQRDLEEYLRQAGNAADQVKFGMGFCIELERDEDGYLRNAAATAATCPGLSPGISRSRRFVA